MSRHRMLFVVMGLLFLLSFPTSLNAQESGVPPPVGLRPDAPPYALHGPYWVGTQDFLIGESSDDELQAHIWYPALNPDGLEEAIAYASVTKDASFPETLDATTYGHALLNAAVDMTNAPYPLVVFSHGFGTAAHTYAHLFEHYASYGFVVIAVEHHEMFNWEFTDLPKASIDRPRDITRTLDYAETLTADSSSMAGMIDMEQVAVAGHSYGGYTALAVAGARFDLTAFNARCAGVDPLVEWICTPLVPFEQEMATLAGYETMPQGLWESFADARVDAIIPMAGDSYLFDQAGLAEITIPVMAMGGTMDNGTPFDWGARPTYDYVSSAKKILVAIEYADHLIFGPQCQNIPWINDEALSTWYPFYCLNTVWDQDRAIDLIRHLSTAFLLAELKGDVDAAAALAPDAASFPGITYEAQGF